LIEGEHTEQQIRHQLRTFIADNFLFGRAELKSDDDSFLECGIIDSTGILELVTYVEQTYKIAVAPDELIPEYFDSVTRLAQFVAFRAGACEPVPQESACADERPRIAVPLEASP
jgi:acyl carrier protein